MPIDRNEAPVATLACAACGLTEATWAGVAASVTALCRATAKETDDNPDRMTNRPTLRPMTFT